MNVHPENEWEPENPEGEYLFNPISILEKTKIPVLAFFGEKDTQADPVQGVQAYKAALERAGNKNFRIEFIPGVDHNLIISETVSLIERSKRSRSEWQNYLKLYLDIIEKWLNELK